MRLTKEQLDKLSDLFIDLAKGLFLAAIAAPAISGQATFIASLRALLTACFLTYLSLKIIELKGGVK